MKKIILIIVFLSFTNIAYSQSEELIFKNTIKRFFQLLKNNDKNNLLKLLDKQIIIQNISKAKLRSLINDLITNKLSALSYLKIISGSNINKFFNINDNQKYEFVSYKFISKIYTDNNKTKNNNIKYNFIKLELLINVITYNESGNIVSKKQIKKYCEIDALKRTNNVELSYEIFGFIL